MKVEYHGNDLIQLTYYGFVNVYLVREEDGFTLVDTALESCASSMVQRASQFGLPIKRILLTHAHADHSGGLDTCDGNGTLIAGDAFQTMGGVAVSGTFKPLFPLVYYATWHKGLALSSARKLRALEPERMAVGHGRLLTEPLAAMDRAIAVAARNLEHQTKKQVPVSRTEREFF